MTVKCRFIFAASASGKTTWLREFEETPVTFRKDWPDGTSSSETMARGYTTNSMVGFDGDEILATFSDWPSFKHWWKGENADHVGFHNLLTIVLSLARAQTDQKNIFCVFNGGVWPFPIIEELYEGIYSEAIELEMTLVEISKDMHTARIDARKKEFEEMGRSDVFPANFQDAHNNREFLRDEATKNDWPIFDDFDEALSDFESKS